MDNRGINFLQPKGVDNFSQLGMTFEGAIGELIDNQVAVGAQRIIIKFTKTDNRIGLIVLDDGKGMNGKTLQYALAFGGEGGEIEEKKITDIGKFHAGLTISSLALSNHVDFYSNNSDGWVKNYIDKDEIKSTGIIFESQNCDEFDEVYSVLEEFKNNHGLEINTGTIILIKELNKDIIGEYNLKSSVDLLYDYLCNRCYIYLKKQCVIHIMVDGEEEIKTCISIPPLLDDDELLEQYGLEVMAKFVYPDIIRVKEVLPFSKIDESADLYISLIRKKAKNDKMKDAPKGVKLDQSTQGAYINRNNLNLIQSLKIGYNQKHNSLNGLRMLIDVNANWDTVLGINVNKSITNLNIKFIEILNERLKNLITHLRKVLTEKEKLNLPIIETPDGRQIKPKILKKSADQELDNDNRDKSLPLRQGSQPISSCENKSVINNENLTTLVFASVGKPKWRYDTEREKITYFRDDEQYLIFNGEIIPSEGIKIKDVENWWKGYKTDQSITLEERMLNSMGNNKFQKKVFNIYNNSIRELFKDNTPALFPEVELFHNSYINDNVDGYSPQRMDFYMVLPNNKKIIIEIDGIHHIGNLIKRIGNHLIKGNGLWLASEKKYSDQCLFDNEWHLNGNEIYRISNFMFKGKTDEEIETFIIKFFKNLLNKHNIKA